MFQQLQAYRQFFDEADEIQKAQWVASTLIWWPLLMPTLASGLRLLPHSAHVSVYISPLLMICWLLTGSFKIKPSENVKFSVALIVALCIAFVVAIGIAQAVALATTFCFAETLVIIAAIVVAQGIVAGCVGGMVFVVAVGVTMGIAIGVVGSIAGSVAAFIASCEAIIVGVIVFGIMFSKLENLENHLKTLQASILARLVFWLVMLAHLFLIGLYVIGLLRL
ncbi:MAG: hypothetical protein DRR16_18200 [Candidatus Parabeggiatoa sp. nov. 3]|nr:MAG: hypothetical protein DRR00_14880 [Gammaproteobacteria bacterium]RKZ68657.1 MAG: hypothetical protein DRQ99_03095 [Gammaproteobacteria bacterium]RKZ83078.1 MAG: hypothetical protein DRR16_18200 [Gammaproteobacteria bacterium]